MATEDTTQPDVSRNGTTNPSTNGTLVAPVPTLDLVDFLGGFPATTQQGGRPSETKSDEQPKKKRARNRTDETDDDLKMRLAQKCAAKFAISVSHQGGHPQTFDLACTIVHKYDLSVAQATDIVREYGSKCDPPWSERELEHKIDDAFCREDKRGRKRGWGLFRREEHKFISWRTRNPNRQQPQKWDSEDIDSEPESAEEVFKKADNDPSSIAASLLVENYQMEDDSPLILYFRDDYYLYDSKNYCYNLTQDWRKTELIEGVQREIDNRHALRVGEFQNLHSDKPEDERPAYPTPVRVTKALVNDVEQHVQAGVSIRRQDDPPLFLSSEPGDPDPRDIIPTRSGILDLSHNPPSLHPHGPRLFSTYVLPYDYEPDPPFPILWDSLLRRQFGYEDGGQQSYDTLTEFIGYCLTSDTSLQKMLLLIGPPRSGRSTIREVLTALLGAANVVSTSAIALGGQFGLEPLLGKKVAVMGDLRTNDIHDSSIMMDRLLRISGEDPLEVNRKNRTMLSNVKLGTRLIIVSNELPNFRDSSGAIVSRYLVVPFSHTIPPEDRNPDLANEIIKTELPGILGLAVEGLQRLRARRRFLQPDDGLDLMALATEIASPIKRFVDEQCNLNVDGDITAEALYNAWRNWALAKGFPIGNDSQFGKNLRSAFPGIKKSRPRERDENNKSIQVTCYEGIELKRGY
ncbi:putative DNA primase/helicase [Singulisphaera sp. GP187]|uniref:DNA primase family protein n=1 Tax=Singulisphaera sp. GP187 TaxID=1882752 RepID=UPI00092AF39A|nr:phage/plasmid primase, P4 family [Singulisphaera sp. GP187]SIN68985.1 putative DNA primase/helicase [Singulisphaera sp. GP187]